MGRKSMRGTATPSDRGRSHYPAESFEERALRQLFDEADTSRIIDRMDADQRTLFEKLIRGPVKQAYVDEQAGTGKTTVAMAVGLTLLRARKVRRLLYIRFPSERGGKLGFLPGELDEKAAIYYGPAYEALAKNGIQREAVEELRRIEVISFMTDVELRGCTLDDAFIIVDEAQNAMDISEMELVLTRFTENIRAAVIGDSRQSDSNVIRYGRERLNAFQVYIRHMTTEKWAERFSLRTNYRGIMAKHAAAVDQTIKLLEGTSDAVQKV